jgi:hypothetical protein
MVIFVIMMKSASAGSFFNYLTAMLLALPPKSSATEMFYHT